MLGRHRTERPEDARDERAEERAEERADAPSPDDPRKPDSVGDIEAPSWRYVLRRTLREFGKDQCTDLAAALTYYAVLALFPGLVALLALVGLVGQGQATVDTLLQVLRDVGAGNAATTLEPTLQQLASSQTAGVAFVVGLATALWSASGYVGSFGRAMNRVYEIREGRPVWKLRPVMLLLTAVAVVLVALVALALVLTGPAASAVGDAIGLGDTAVLVWNIAKWPVVLGAVVLVVALLYYVTPNVQQPRFRWISLGAVLAIVVWLVASTAFGFYVANFGSYNRTYGSLAGVAVFLLWLWITNLALLLGAELDAELERGRELQAGIAAEESIQLPPRDTHAIEKSDEKHADDVRAGRRLRHAARRRPEGSDEG
ncbi:YihY/virulence factor BrkB family protein [Nocardioides zeae]|uniref:YihY/virulence factor BrkB family protein n=1 Tax=Nocardioides zeae TaxID=1457234 RepID=A0A6P0HIF9_9ACTN|nr:YihY/virulence factor BrkB family protein [Nocardioides zeae]NEN78391.1 YihY/virulence factor BrkB family protein [Nocardioides zeae]